MLGVAIPSPAQRKLWNKGKAVCVKGVKDYQVTFWRVFNLFSEPPVFKFVGGVANITTETISVGFASSDRTSGPAENFRLLGFDPFEGVTADNIVGCAKLEIYIRTNKPLVDILQKCFPDGVKYPCGWDFDMQPIAVLHATNCRPRSVLVVSSHQNTYIIQHQVYLQIDTKYARHAL